MKGVRKWYGNFICEDSKKEALNSKGDAEAGPRIERSKAKQTKREGTSPHFTVQVLRTSFTNPLFLLNSPSTFPTSQNLLPQSKVKAKLWAAHLCFCQQLSGSKLGVILDPPWQLEQHSESSLGLLLHYIIYHKEYIVTESTKTSLKMVGEFRLPPLSHYWEGVLAIKFLPSISTSLPLLLIISHFLPIQLLHT